MKTEWKQIAVLWGLIALPAMIPGLLVDSLQLLNDWRFYIQALAFSVPQALLVLLIMELSSVHPTENPHVDRVFGLQPPSPFGRSLVIILLTVVVALIVAAGVRLLVELVFPQSEQPVWRFENRALLPLALPAMIAIAYREELFFRSFLLTRLQMLDIAPVSRVTAGGLLFGLAHLSQGFIGILVATIIGLLFGIVFERYRNLHIVAVAHALYNMVVLLAAG